MKTTFDIHMQLRCLAQLGVAALCVLFSAEGYAQYGQEWVNHEQQYWKFDVVEDGIHTVDYQTLVNAGFPVGTIDPRNIQVIGRQKEIQIQIDGEDDGVFNPQDKILIYAKGNDGWLDTETYLDPGAQNNKFHSLFNDTASYFITYNDDLDNLRMDIFEADNFNDYEPADYCWFRSRQNYTEEYLQGKRDINGIALPWYEAGEGWFAYKFAQGQTVNKQIPTPSVFTGPDAPDARVYSTTASASSALGAPNHHLQLGWGSSFQLMVDTVFHGYQLNSLDFSLPANALSGTTQISHRSIDDLGVATDYNAISSIEIAYPRTWNFGSTSSIQVNFPNTTTEPVGRIDFQFNGPDPRLLIVQNGYTAEVDVFGSGGNWQALVPFVFGAAAVELYLTDESNFHQVSSIKPVNGNGFFTDFEALQPDSAYILISHQKLMSAASNYAAYKSGNGMDVVLIDVDELYDQYAAGIRKHPLAIRRFCDHVLNTWTSRPSHLFIVGKSIHEMDISASPGARNSEELYARNLIPTWGWPTTDLAFTSGLYGTVLEAAIPTGRLAAETPEQVSEYLNKVIEHDAQVPAEWMKQVMHFGGGGTQYEQTLFGNYLRGYEVIVEDTCFGGNVHAFYKSTTDPIQMNLSDSITYLIENGVSLMTFFGHASSTGFDQNIDSPGNYNNQGKYPLLIGNSCYTGNIHLAEGLSTSEVFVLVPQRGMIGFIAKSDLGVPSNLNEWTKGFYHSIFQDNYGQSVGQAMVEAVKSFQLDGSDLYDRNTALTFGLHGDPSVQLNPQEKPDYKVQDDYIFFDPKEVTAQLDSFQVKIAVNNIGKGINGEFGVELIRHLPIGPDTSLTQIVTDLMYTDTLIFTLPVDRVNGVGLNTFDVFVDFPSILVDELDNIGNNIVQNKSLLITSGDLIPIWPYEYAVIPENSVTLKASTGFAFEPVKEYIFQVDTVDTFNSMFMLENSVTSGGGVVEWDLPVTLQDSTVYYWRASADSIDDNGYNWRESSFQYIQNQSGWGQAHFDQFKRDKFKRIDYNIQDSRLDYTTNDLELKCSVYGNPSTSYQVLATRYQIDLEVMDYACCAQSASMIVAVMDSVTLEPWETNYNGTNPQNNFGNMMDCSNNRSRPEKYFIFRQNQAADLQGFVDMMENQVEDGHYILIYSWKYIDYDGWQANAPEVFDVFSDLGANVIGNSTDSIPFIFFMKKGYPETIQELVGSSLGDFIELEANMEGIIGVGEIESVKIGPAFEWDALYWTYVGEDEPATDSTRIKLYGVQSGNIEEQLADFYQQPNEILDLETYADAETWPELRLEAYLEDMESQTPAQLKSWHVMYEKVPEVALNPSLGFVFESEEVMEGADLKLAIAIDNIGDVDMDSLLISYWLEDAQQHLHPIAYQRQAPLPAGQNLMDTLTISTTGFAGSNLLWVEVNPINLETGYYDQPEQYHFNNIAQIGFRVNEDNQNPILDVTFDGIRILDGDLVSAQPTIVISVDDENPFFIMDQLADTSVAKLYITTPEFVQRPVYFNSPEINWIPADPSDNNMLIEYRPVFTLDGEYELLVQASDKSGNSSGDRDFRIGFEIFTKPTITEVMNYPNPFSTRTQFVFTLTGTTPPDYVMIQIMTISGRIVREIHSAEIGPLNIGRNFTEYWWDGRDQFGDPLANGIYLYRVIVKDQGEDLELRSTEAAQYFKKGFGKMYLLR